MPLSKPEMAQVQIDIFLVSLSTKDESLFIGNVSFLASLFAFYFVYYIPVPNLRCKLIISF